MASSSVVVYYISIYFLDNRSSMEYFYILSIAIKFLFNIPKTICTLLSTWEEFTTNVSLISEHSNLYEHIIRPSTLNTFDNSNGTILPFIVYNDLL